ncbi:SepM family pheromone-processing serine protease [Fructilactobacillus fructivorans]|uniref:Lon-like protease with PDZ domain n=1 Tax=Fructilactobacillus fructivorans TaxID=1614 RepID=A0A0C1PKR3_9LACO|nr:SepM family pheromone-processing serine protease [Fructilactobacillus fructivorans]KID41272.1 Lon-like protease with PDZ domain [Fructilactobacillus fructivorans]MCT0152126.1 PDZ domain-containing protein [Fructilactobacillus fructivorans]MCT2867791.1 PDZ domain-containing protein [Fructilactobacillus fructivorans]MCT2868405.1 PDZ domain-containing protein [Fructilactobacillus fructivorans]MCT2873832.1 PDZ domain-containing protein [Fructilactobacillus fructivorans]
MKKIWKWIKHNRYFLIFLGIIVFILWFLFWPLNALIEAPGEAVNIQPMVKIQGVKPNKQNKFMITAVSMSQARPITYLYSKVNPHVSLEKTSDVMGNQSNEEYDNVQNIYMKSAINNAIYVGYHKAHAKVKQSYHGVYVLNVYPHSDFSNKLKPGDLVESVNGKKLYQGPQYVKYIQGLPKHAELKITFKRNGKTKQVKGYKKQLVRGFYGIGIGMVDDVSLKTSPKANINPGKIGGPSGGLMFALQVYSELKHTNYDYKRIAGTGTIASNGQVGEIGGVDKKIIAANKSGAQIFFCPYVKPTKTILRMEDGHQTNYQVAQATAKKYAPKMKVVPVTSFDDALKYLNQKHS